MQFSVTPEYFAVGGNHYPSCADWDATTGVLCFGSGCNIALWQIEGKQSNGIISLLHGHSGSVTAVKYFHLRPSDVPLILSGSADHSVRIWQTKTSSLGQGISESSLTDHKGSINCFAAHEQSSLFVSGAADGTVKVWKIRGPSPGITAELLQDLRIYPRLIPLTLGISSLGQDEAIVLAVGGTRNVVQIYSSQSSDNISFSLSASLSGHEAWIRSLDFKQESNTEDADILLASASQDKYIRLWRLQRRKNNRPQTNGTPSPLAEVTELLKNKTQSIATAGDPYDITFEALLLGHEDWIYTVQWNHDGQQLSLLSASADNSLAVWEPDKTSGIWVPATRLGEISAQKGSTTATGSTGGFWIGLWLRDDNSVACLGRTGSWRRWTRTADSGTWNQQLGVSGHTNEVRDIAWSPSGSYLLSASADQTTRVHAQWLRDHYSSWHEFARPQIHGYDLNCIETTSDLQFVSGADEKLLRVFDASRTFIHALCGEQIAGTMHEEQLNGTSVPVLGLSNKASTLATNELQALEVLLASTEKGKRAVFEPGTGAIHRSPPYEDELARETLWPEREKLYGHGFEISCLAISNSGEFVATACKASSIEHAVIRIYERQSWRPLNPPLSVHTLTVTSMRFSDDDRYLLSVGRDRQWAIFERQVSEASGFVLKFNNPKGHARMVLGCAWAPSRVGRIFGTAGRDKLCKIWSLDGESFACNDTVTSEAAITSIDICAKGEEECIMALGAESGAVIIHVIQLPAIKVAASFNVEQGLCPALAVTKLCWQPPYHDGFKEGIEQEQRAKRHRLAIASQDHSVTIVKVCLA